MATSTIFSATLNADGGFYPFTIVQRLTPTALTLPSAGILKIRVTFQSGAAERLQVTNAYIGHRAGSGDAYDFSATPVQLLFSTSAGFSISSATQIASDWADFAYNKTSDLLISYYVGVTNTADTVRQLASVANTNSYYKNANEAATVNKTGYTDGSTTVLGIAKVEVMTPDGGVAVTMISEFGMM